MTHATPAIRTGAVMPRESVGWDADTALEQLYAAHWRRLVRLSVLLVRDVATAEEVVQDSFVAVHGRWSKLRDPDRALAYLRQTVVNRSRSALRHRAVVARHAAREVVSPTHPGADESALVTDRRGAVLDAMRELPDRQREVLALRYYLDLSEAEIAATLGISRGAVKSHASRGASALRELLKGELS
jgi:RNA polymerase sigma-70 factor (sigma-E family)